jgi:hypothetical protein
MIVSEVNARTQLNLGERLAAYPDNSMLLAGDIAVLKTVEPLPSNASEFRQSENTPPKNDPIHSPWPCRRCGSTTAIPGPGKGPHHARLTCADCGTFSRWLSVNQTMALGLSVNGGSH